MRREVTSDDWHGAVSRRRLQQAGWSRSRIDRAIRAGRLVPVHAGVFAVGHVPRTPEFRWAAALLACRGAVLSHRSAAQLWGLPLSDNGLTHVTAPSKRERRLVDCHQGRLADADHTIQRGFPVTTVARTLADLAHVLDDTTLHRAVKEAQFRGLSADDRVQDALTRRPSARLRAYLHDPTVTQSKLEDRFLRLCRCYGIPTPLTQHGTKPRVDFTWPDRHLVVEVDGWEAHRTRVAFQDDRTNTNLLQLRGDVVLRYTWDDVRVRHAEVAAQVRYAGNFSRIQSGPSSARR